MTTFISAFFLNVFKAADENWSFFWLVPREAFLLFSFSNGAAAFLGEVNIGNVLLSLA